MQEDVPKRVLAYSTIAQYGYIVFLLGPGTSTAAAGALFYILVHALLKSALFMTAGAVFQATGRDQLSSVGGVARSMPGLAVASAIAAAGLAGIPLTAGFFKDKLLLKAALERGTWLPDAVRPWQPGRVVSRCGADAVTALIYRDPGRGMTLRSREPVTVSETWLPWLIDGLVVLGLSIMSVVVFGLFRLPDIYGQLHAASKAVVLGVVPMLLSVTLLGDATITVRALLIGMFILLTTSLSAHAIGQAAFQRGEPMHGADSIDETGQRGRRPKKKKAEE